jgi:hypothetical protein
VIRFPLFRCKPVNCEQWLGICLSISTWNGMEWIRVTFKASECRTHRRRSLAIIMLISEARATEPCENTEWTSKPVAILCESNTVAVASCQAHTVVVRRNRLQRLLGPRRWRTFLRKAGKNYGHKASFPGRPESPTVAVAADSFIYLFVVKFRKQGWSQRNSPAKNAVQAVCMLARWP